MLLLDRVADVDTKIRREVQSKVRAKIVDDPLGIVRIAGDIGLGQFCVEASIFTDLGDRHVIWMRIDRVRHEQPIEASDSIGSE